MNAITGACNCNRSNTSLNNGKTRASLFGLVALYLLYISYQLFQGRNETDTTMTPAARYLFIALFVIASVLVLIYAWRTWKHSKQEDDAPPQEDDKTSLK